MPVLAAPLALGNKWFEQRRMPSVMDVRFFAASGAMQGHVTNSRAAEFLEPLPASQSCAPFGGAKKVSSAFDVTFSKVLRDQPAIPGNLSRGNATT